MKFIGFLAATLLASADALPDIIPNIRGTKTILGRYEKGVQQPSETPVLNSPKVQGCFKSSGELKMNRTIEFNSIGECATKVCYVGGYSVAGTMGGNQCWCGNTYPPKEDVVEDKNCNAPCSGYDQEACGGSFFWTIYNTGLTLAVRYSNEQSTSTSSSATKTAEPTSVVSLSQSTVVVTQPPESEVATSSGPNVAGIVAGVVVGVVVAAGITAGVFLYMRKKRNDEIEAEHRRNAAVNAFMGKPPGSSGGLSMTDSRLDPVMAHRRMSDGSIADNQDYSRKILRVTNA